MMREGNLDEVHEGSLDEEGVISRGGEVQRKFSSSSQGSRSSTRNQDEVVVTADNATISSTAATKIQTKTPFSISAEQSRQLQSLQLQRMKELGEDSDNSDIGDNSDEDEEVENEDEEELESCDSMMEEEEEGSEEGKERREFQSATASHPSAINSGKASLNDMHSNPSSNVDIIDSVGIPVSFLEASTNSHGESNNIEVNDENDEDSEEDEDEDEDEDDDEDDDSESDTGGVNDFLDEGVEPDPGITLDDLIRGQTNSSPSTQSPPQQTSPPSHSATPPTSNHVSSPASFNAARQVRPAVMPSTRSPTMMAQGQMQQVRLPHPIQRTQQSPQPTMIRQPFASPELARRGSFSNSSTTSPTASRQYAHSFHGSNSGSRQRNANSPRPQIPASQQQLLSNLQLQQQQQQQQHHHLQLHLQQQRQRQQSPQMQLQQARAQLHPGQARMPRPLSQGSLAALPTHSTRVCYRQGELEGYYHIGDDQRRSISLLTSTCPSDHLEWFDLSSPEEFCSKYNLPPPLVKNQSSYNFCSRDLPWVPANLINDHCAMVLTGIDDTPRLVAGYGWRCVSAPYSWFILLKDSSLGKEVILSGQVAENMKSISGKCIVRGEDDNNMEVGEFAFSIKGPTPFLSNWKPIVARGWANKYVADVMQKSSSAICSNNIDSNLIALFCERHNEHILKQALSTGPLQGFSLKRLCEMSLSDLTRYLNGNELYAKRLMALLEFILYIRVSARQMQFQDDPAHVPRFDIIFHRMCGFEELLTKSNKEVLDYISRTRQNQQYPTKTIQHRVSKTTPFPRFYHAESKEEKEELKMLSKRTEYDKRYGMMDVGSVPAQQATYGCAGMSLYRRTSKEHTICHTGTIASQLFDFFSEYAFYLLNRENCIRTYCPICSVPVIKIACRGGNVAAVYCFLRLGTLQENRNWRWTQHNREVFNLLEAFFSKLSTANGGEITQSNSSSNNSSAPLGTEQDKSNSKFKSTTINDSDSTSSFKSGDTNKYDDDDDDEEEDNGENTNSSAKQDEDSYKIYINEEDGEDTKVLEQNVYVKPPDFVREWGWLRRFVPFVLFLALLHIVSPLVLRFAFSDEGTPYHHMALESEIAVGIESFISLFLIILLVDIFKVYKASLVHLVPPVSGVAWGAILISLTTVSTYMIFISISWCNAKDLECIMRDVHIAVHFVRTLLFSLFTSFALFIVNYPIVPPFALVNSHLLSAMALTTIATSVEFSLFAFFFMDLPDNAIESTGWEKVLIPWWILDLLMVIIFAVRAAKYDFQGWDDFAIFESLSSSFKKFRHTHTHSDETKPLLNPNSRPSVNSTQASLYEHEEEEEEGDKDAIDQLRVQNNSFFEMLWADWLEKICCICFTRAFSRRRKARADVADAMYIVAASPDPVTRSPKIDLTKLKIGSVKKIESGFTTYNGTFCGHSVMVERANFDAALSLGHMILDHSHPIEVEKVLSTLESHKNILKFYGTGRDKHNMFFVLESPSRGSLSTILEGPIDSLGLKLRVHLSLDLARGLDYIHSQGVLHRNIHPGSLYIADNFTLKIGGFERSRMFIDGDRLVRGRELAPHDSSARPTTPRVGIPLFMPPEVADAGNTAGYNSKADVFMFGLTMWCILAHVVRPFTGHRLREVDGIIASGVRPLLPPTWDSRLCKIMARCWKGVAMERTEMKVIAAQLPTILKSL